LFEELSFWEESELFPEDPLFDDGAGSRRAGGDDGLGAGSLRTGGDEGISCRIGGSERGVTDERGGSGCRVESDPRGVEGGTSCREDSVPRGWLGGDPISGGEEPRSDERGGV
jgi:hypothetical protein